MTKRRYRLPKKIEIEIAKLLSTIGFADYGKLLWDLAEARPPAGVEAPVLSPRTERREFSSEFQRQIRDQARHDPTILAAGTDNLPLLPQIQRDLLSWWGVSAGGLLETLGERPSVVLLVGRLDAQISVAIAQVTAYLRKSGAVSFVLIVTDEKRCENSNPTALETDPHLRKIYWRDWCADGREFVPRFLAQVIHVSGAAAVVSFRSHLAVETIRRHGRALRACHRLYAVFALPSDVEREATDAGLSPTDIHNLRLVAPFVTPVTLRERDAARFRAKRIGLNDAGIHSLEASAHVFGDDFSDHRSETSRRVIARLLQTREHKQPPIESVVAREDQPRDVDITVTIVLHRERELAVPALASLHDMIEAARADGLTVESRAVLDRPDDETRELVAAHGRFLDDILTVSFGDLPVTRNASAKIARGRFLAFLDGDDLWSANWLSLCHRAAIAHEGDPAIWHPEALLTFFASDCDRQSADLKSKFYVHRSSAAPDFEPRDILLENLWSANSFARKEVYDRFPYRPTDPVTQSGIEDWRWNLETLGHGIEHLIVPDTVHIIRVKEDGSLGQDHEANGRLPML